MPPKKISNSVKNNQQDSLKTTNTKKNLFAALVSDSESETESESDNLETVNNIKNNKNNKNNETLKNSNVVKLDNIMNTPPQTVLELDNLKSQGFMNFTETTQSAQSIQSTQPIEQSHTGQDSWTPIVKTNKNDEKKFNKCRPTGKYDDKILEYKQMYDENEDYGDIGNDKKLNSQWAVWIHQTDNNDWTLHGYQKRYIINSIGSFWRFFNNFQLFDLYKNQIFIMRNEIAPIWEDVNNKFGGICSIQVESTQRGFKTDVSTEIFVSICMLIMNETLIVSGESVINGISYSVRKKKILIKLWTRTFYEENKFVDELPKTLINKFNSELQKHLMGTQFENNYKMSIQYKKIKPEYEL